MIALLHLSFRCTHRSLVRTQVSTGHSFCSAAKLTSATHATTAAVWKVTVTVVFVMFVCTGKRRSDSLCNTLSSVFSSLLWQFYSPFSFQKSTPEEEWVLPLQPSARSVYKSLTPSPWVGLRDVASQHVYMFRDVWYSEVGRMKFTNCETSFLRGWTPQQLWTGPGCVVHLWS